MIMSELGSAAAGMQTGRVLVVEDEESLALGIRDAAVTLFGRSGV